MRSTGIVCGIAGIFTVLASFTCLIEGFLPEIADIVKDRVQNRYHDKYDAVAHRWAESLLTASDYELVAIANLLYWSRERSASTLLAQEAELELATMLAQGMHTSNSTRLDPSRALSHQLDLDLFDKVAIKFKEAYAYQRRASQTYARCVEQIVDGPLIRSMLVKKQVHELRHMARAIVKYHVVGTLSQATQSILQAYTMLKNNHDTQQENCKRNFITSVLESIPLYLMKSFIASDKRFCCVSDKAWQALLSGQLISNQVWSTLEQPRLKFYQACYAALYSTISKRKSIVCDKLCMLLDEQGLIPEDQQCMSLPLPA